ncbi:MAG: leucine-rich repeat domain-containing protein [Bacteroidales bacterium]|nr:leucine-rich repeat domain-containing protein [Bacteroidales bacterium]
MKKTLFLVLCLIAASFACTQDFSYSYSGKTLYYHVISATNHTVMVCVPTSSTTYTSMTGSVTIPSSVSYNGVSYSVTEIGSWAFEDCSHITSVNIPSTVEYIDNWVFLNCSSLTSITIPSSVVSIGDYSFAGCSGLTTMSVNANNPYYDSRNNCKAIIRTSSNQLIAGCKNTVIPNNITAIRAGAFYKCTGLTSVSIPNTVTYIGNYAFEYCSGLTSITIPNSVTYIGSEVFSKCTNLSSIIVGSGNTVYDSRNNCKAIIETATNRLIAGCKNTVIPSTVTSIADYAFYGCSGLTSINIPPLVTKIGDNAFEDCTGLTSINIPHLVTKIGNSVFKNCTGLTTISIGSSIDSLHYHAFLGCSNVNTVTCYANNPPTIYGGTSYYLCGCSHLISTLKVPCSRQSYYSSWSNYFNQINCVSTYSLTAQSNNSSYGNVVGGGNYASGSSATLSATANNGYYFSHWNDNNTTNPRTVQVTSNQTYTAYFSPCQYSVTVNSNNTNWGSVSGGGNYYYGSSVTLTATPQNHYHFVSWSDNVTTNPRTLTVTSDSTITAIFAIDQHSVTVTANNQNYGSVSGSGTYNYGSTATLSATPSQGRYFSHWSDNETSNPRTIQVLSDTAFVAVFTPYQYSITLSSNNDDWGSVSGGGTYDYGSTVTMTATPQSHYHFVRWSDYYTTNPRQYTVTADVNFIAYFAIDQHNVSATPNNPNWGSVSGGGTYDYGSTTTLVAVPVDAHHYFSNWNDGNTDASRLVTVLSDTVFTAQFGVEQHIVTATSADPSMGFVTGDGSYDYGSSATITAHPLTGFKFLHWNDGNTNANRTFTVTQDCEFVAYFGPLQGIDEVSDANSSHRFSLYPNPAAESVTLRMNEEDGEAIFTVYDISGKTMLKERITGGNAIFSVVDWPQGVYYVKMNYSDGNTLIGRFIVK